MLLLLLLLPLLLPCGDTQLARIISCHVSDLCYRVDCRFRVRLLVGVTWQAAFVKSELRSNMLAHDVGRRHAMIHDYVMVSIYIGSRWLPLFHPTRVVAFVCGNTFQATGAQLVLNPRTTASSTSLHQ